MKKQSFIVFILVISIALLVLLVLEIITFSNISGFEQAAAADLIIPHITTVDPSTGFNDLDASIIITGTDFTAVLSGTLVITSPAVTLGNTPLVEVTWVTSTTLTATVPWGLDPGVYSLRVVNLDGGSDSLTNAFTVTQGINSWNGGNLFGGNVRQILMKPGDSSTLYASSYGIAGLFRSRDAGEHWMYATAMSVSNGKFAVDPLHPNWLYAYDNNGLNRSQDQGDTWTVVMPNTWPDGRTLNSPQVFTSPYNPQVLFINSSESYGNPYPGQAYGLIKSTDGGSSWHIVTDMEGIPAQDLAFHPTDALKMVLATSDVRVFQSTDGGDTWSEVARPPMVSLGLGGSIVYNPYKPSEVWITAPPSQGGGIYKSMDASFTNWQDMTSGTGLRSPVVAFTGTDSIYITGYHSINGGLAWQPFGPQPWFGDGTILFDPQDTQIAYIGDGRYGIQKTNDSGQTFEVKNQGLTGMVCNQMKVSHANPLRIYAVCGSWPGIYRSDDGASHWNFIPIGDSNNTISLIQEDPFDAQHLYAVGNSFYVSTDGGLNWSDLGWNITPPAPDFGPSAIEADPFQQGHLLLSMRGPGDYGMGDGKLFSSSDYGVSWQEVTLPQVVKWIPSFTFDPQTSGLVYFPTGGTGIYRSANGGVSWERIDDAQQSDMQYIGVVAIALHPQHALFVISQQGPYRSFDGGVTWERVPNWPGGFYHAMFINGDSTRLYVATGYGLYFSKDLGDTWEAAAGTLGGLQITTFDYALVDGRAILYAATNGGTPGTTINQDVNIPQQVFADGTNLVNAGIYRYVQITWPIFLPLIKR